MSFGARSIEIVEKTVIIVIAIDYARVSYSK